MNEKQQLDTHSRNFFVAGLFLNRLRVFGPKIFVVICFLTSAVLYLGGYISWLLSIHYSHAAKASILDDFKEGYEKQYKNLPQYFVAAIVGIVASLFLFASFWLPVICGLISCWLYVFSNTFWCWAEEINLERLRLKPNSSLWLEVKENYLTYSSLTTINSLLIACSMTLCLLIPSIAIPIGLIFSTFVVALNIHMFHYWAKTVLLTLQLRENDIEQDSVELSQSYARLQRRNDFVEKENLDSVNQFVSPNKPIPPLLGQLDPITEWPEIINETNFSI